MIRSILGLLLCLGLASSGLTAPAEKETPGTEINIARPKHTNAWPDAKLADFLADGNRPEGVMIKRLVVRQKNKRLPLYVQTGAEERRRNLRERPILALAKVRGPFARAIRFVARVDRARGLAIDLDLEHVVRSAFSSSGIRRRPLPRLYVYLRPGKDQEIVLPGENGRFAFEIPGERHCGEAHFQFRSGDERHEIILVFLNRKRPVTLKKPAFE